MLARAPLSSSPCRWRAHLTHDAWHARSDANRARPPGLSVPRALTGVRSIGDQVVKRDARARVIAVVDDDQGFRDALQLFLRTFAFQVDAFASGQEFLRSSRLDAVGCVILDLAMPEMNGLEVKEQLAARGLQIPIVFVTAHRDEYLGQRASAAGALAVLRKPVDHEQLVRLVREALGE